MKIFFLIYCFLFLTVTSYSQQNQKSQSRSYEDYLEISKMQNTVGWVMIGAGVVMAGIPIYIYTRPDFDATYLNSPIGFIAMGMGMIMIPGGAGFLIASGSSKRKAMSLSFKNETTPYIQNGNLFTKTIPSLSLKIGF